MLQKPDLNKPAFLFMPTHKAKIMNGQCPRCSNEIKEKDFTNDLAKREYAISGMCQGCQNAIFSEPEED